jgi:hypothetical protein
VLQTTPPTNRAQPGIGLATGGLALAGAIAAVTAAILSELGSDRALSASLALAETFGAALLIRLGWSRTREWLSAGVVLGAAWVAAFLIPSWILVADPGLLQQGINGNLDPRRASVISTPSVPIGLMCIAVYAVCAGYWLIARRDERREVTYVEVQPVELRRWRLVAWYVVALGAFAYLYSRAGGPLNYITSFDQSVQLTSGVVYFVGLGLCAKNVVLVLAARRWAERKPLGWRLWAFAALTAGLVVTLGARALLAAMLVELLLLYALMVRRPSARVVVPVVAVLGALVIFGFGTVKRYQSYSRAYPQVSFVDYVRDHAAPDAAAVYVNNYADGLRLAAEARGLVPSQAPYEHGKVLVRLVAQVLPSGVRPELKMAPATDLAFNPVGSTPAIPLPVTAYLQAGLVGVALVLAAFGALVALLDRWLRVARANLLTVLVLVALVVQVPLILRTGDHKGVSMAGLEIGLLALVAWTSTRRAREPTETPSQTA